MSRHLALVACLSVGILLVACADMSRACMAISEPDIRIIRTQNNDEHAVAFVSAYNCEVMRAKTYCCIGIRFEPNAAMKRAKIRVHDMRFVQAATGQPIPDFNPTKKDATAKSFENELDGYWYGFWALFPKTVEIRGLSEIRVEFTMAPGTTDDDLKEAFRNSHVGTAEGNAEGVVIKGEHHEILKTMGIRVFSVPKEEKGARSVRHRRDDQDDLNDVNRVASRRERKENRRETPRDVEDEDQDR